MLSAVLLGAGVSSSRAFAGDEPAATVTVTAPAISETQARAPTSFATVIDPAEHTDRLETAADALAESVGVTVRRFGGLGAFSTLSIRGSSANQVQLYLDGIPLSRARNETVNLADLPLDSLERIEVYRGTAPVGFGAAGIGGVVNLVTKLPSATPETELAGSYGSFATRKVVGAHAQQVGGVDLLGYVTYLGSNGDFPYQDPSPRMGTDQTRAVNLTRQNNAFDSVDALLKGGYSLARGLRLDLTSETFFKDQGVPGVGNGLSLHSSFREVRALNYLRLSSSDWLVDSLDLAATLYGLYERDAFRDLKGDIGTGQQNRNDDTRVIGGNMTSTYFLPPHPILGAHTLGAFAEASSEIFSPSNDVPNPDSEPNEERLHTVLAVQDQVGYASDRLLLVPTLRWEHLRDSADGVLAQKGRPRVSAVTSNRDLWTPTLGAQVQLWPWLSVRGNIGRFQRAPNFTELFGNSGSIIGNSKLRPETGVNHDIGFVATVPPFGMLDNARLEYVYFDNEIDDLIVLVRNANAFAQVLNVSTAHVGGHELTVHAILAQHVGIDANFTHQDAENRDAKRNNGFYFGRRLPGRPAEEVYTRLELFNARGKLYYEFNYVSGTFLDEANFKPVSSRDVHTLGVTVNVAPHAALTFEARNLTDNQIRDIEGFPLPGRAFFGTLKLTL